MQGAAEIVTLSCGDILDEDLNRTSNDNQTIVDNVIYPLAKEGLIPVSYAYKDVPTSDIKNLMMQQG